MLIKILTFNFLLIPFVLSDPLIIKTISSQNQQQQEEGDGVYQVLGKKGISSYLGDLGFNKDNQGKYVSVVDSGKFLHENTDNKNHLNSKDLNEASFYKNDGGLLHNVDEKAGHKKGHHKSGFQNTYHKEESGSKSNYYDDSDDEGGRLLQDRRNGIYSDGSSRRNHGSYQNDGKYVNGNSRNGYYDNKGILQKGFGNQRRYNEERFNDDRLLNSQNNRGNGFGESGNKYYSESYREPYYNYNDDYYYNRGNTGNLGRYVPTPKRTIAIYEDPRYQGGITEYSDYDQPVRLEVKPFYKRSSHGGLLYDHDYY